jgi:hypothetical protein
MFFNNLLLHQSLEKKLISVRLFKTSLILNICQLLQTRFRERDEIGMGVQEYIINVGVCVVDFYLYRN